MFDSQNNADTNNKVEIQFSVKVLDHVLLVNNSKHWIGVGLQAGLRVLWVEQQSFIIMKVSQSRRWNLLYSLPHTNIFDVERRLEAVQI